MRKLSSMRYTFLMNDNSKKIDGKCVRVWIQEISEVEERKNRSKSGRSRIRSSCRACFLVIVVWIHPRFFYSSLYPSNILLYVFAIKLGGFGICGTEKSVIGILGEIGKTGERKHTYLDLDRAASSVYL